MTQLKEVKEILVKKMESKFNDLTVEVARAMKEKRKVLANRMDTLDRFYVQVRYLEELQLSSHIRVRV